MANFTDDFIGLEQTTTEISEGTGWSAAMIEDYSALSTDLRSLANAVDANYMLVSTGSPEGSVAANKSRQYYDTTGAVGSRFFVNSTVGATTGWVAIN